MYDEVTYDTVLEKKLGVMDMEAITMCRDENIKIVVMNIDTENGLVRLMNGEKIGTIVK